MARGNRREAIFLDDEDRRGFLETLDRACQRTGWLVHAWVVLSNHYHLALETPAANLVAGMQWFQNTITRRFNVRHRKWGRVFGDRYKAVLIEGREGYYYETLLDYIHLNPVRAGLILPARGESVLDFAWSSVGGGIALPSRRRPGWFAGTEVLAAFGWRDTAAGRRAFVERLDRRARPDPFQAPLLHSSTPFNEPLIVCVLAIHIGKYPLQAVEALDNNRQCLVRGRVVMKSKGLINYTVGVRPRKDQMEKLKELYELDPELDFSEAVRRGLDMFIAEQGGASLARTLEAERNRHLLESKRKKAAQLKAERVRIRKQAAQLDEEIQSLNKSIQHLSRETRSSG